jgi:hypothetical protein
MIVASEWLFRASAFLLHQKDWDSIHKGSLLVAAVTAIGNVYWRKPENFLHLSCRGQQSLIAHPLLRGVLKRFFRGDLSLSCFC